MKSRPWYYSWWVIVLAFIIFWPIGIVLLILRNSSNKKSAFLGNDEKKKYMIAGIVLIVLGLLFLTESGVVGFFMIVGGGALIYYSEQLKKKSIRNRQYIELIVNQQETSIDKIANVCQIQYDTAYKELASLIERNVLKDYVIDANYHTIMKNASEVQNDNYYTDNNEMYNEQVYASQNVYQNSQPEQNEIVTCICPGCGAKIMLKRGTSTYCEYCDAPIVAK